MHGSTDGSSSILEPRAQGWDAGKVGTSPGCVHICSPKGASPQKKPLSPKTPKAELCAALPLGNVLLPAPRAQLYAREKSSTLIKRRYRVIHYKGQYLYLSRDRTWKAPRARLFAFCPCVPPRRLGQLGKAGRGHGGGAEPLPFAQRHPWGGGDTGRDGASGHPRSPGQHRG